MSISPRKLWSSDKVRFLVVGSYNTLFGFVAFALLYAWLGDPLHYLVIATISHFIAVTNAYFSHRVLVFRAQGALLPAYLRFNVATLGTLVGGLTLMALLVDLGGFNPLLAQGVVVMVNAVFSYFTHKLYTFGLPS